MTVSFSLTLGMKICYCCSISYPATLKCVENLSTFCGQCLTLGFIKGKYIKVSIQKEVLLNGLAHVLLRTIFFFFTFLQNFSFCLFVLVGPLSYERMKMDVIQKWLLKLLLFSTLIPLSKKGKAFKTRVFNSVCFLFSLYWWLWLSRLVAYLYP